MPLVRRWTHRLCEAWDGTRVLATGLDGTQTIVEIESVSEPGGVVERRTFVYRLVRYFEGPGGEFVPSLFDAKVGYNVLLKGAATGLSDAEVSRNKFYFGKNLADVPVKGYLSLLVDEILHPFYIFQVWSVVVWYLEPYIMYATAIAIISLVSALVSLFSARRNLENIRHMAHFVCPVTVRRRIGDAAKPEVMRCAPLCTNTASTLSVRPLSVPLLAACLDKPLNLCSVSRLRAQTWCRVTFSNFRTTLCFPATWFCAAGLVSSTKAC